MGQSVNVNWKADEAMKQLLSLANDKLKDFVENTVDIAKTEHDYVDRTGTNSSSITWDMQEGKFRIYTTSGYGGWLELGTSRMPPYKCILPAIEQSKKEILGK